MLSVKRFSTKNFGSLTGRGGNLLASLNFFHFHSKATAFKHRSNISMFSFISALSYFTCKTESHSARHQINCWTIKSNIFVLSFLGRDVYSLLRTLFSFSGGNDNRIATEDENKAEKKSKFIGFERKINRNDNFSHHHRNVCRLLLANEVEIKDRLALVFGLN